jgi:hypothetical protein
MPNFYWEIEQGSAAWFKMHSTIPTASMFDNVITPAKGLLSEKRHKYAVRIIAARLLNWTPDSLDKIDHIREGKRKEPFAAAQLELIRDIETVPVGFVTSSDGRFGASPDRLARVDGDRTHAGITVEIKSPTIPTQLYRLLFGHDDAYKCQVAGQLYVTEADKAIFYSYSDRMPAYLFEVGRDEAFIKKLADALERFNDELEELQARARNLGAYQAFSEILTPAEAEYGDRYRPPSEQDLEDLINGPIGEFG